jgi:hypothetical protein
MGSQDDVSFILQRYFVTLESAKSFKSDIIMFPKALINLLLLIALFYASHLSIYSMSMHHAASLLTHNSISHQELNNIQQLNKDFFLYGDFIYKNNIRTVLFNKKGFELAPPHLRMGSGETLELRFDDLDSDYKNYHYTIVHCNADWTMSSLDVTEYLDGFYEDLISDYSRSFNTRTQYTHYYLEFPNHNMRPRISGNYLLKVFTDGNRDDVVLTRRFMIFEPLVHVEASVNMANMIMYRDTKQQVGFTIDATAYRIPNPHQEMKVVITQNGRWDNAITGLPPRGIQGTRYVYDYEIETLFEGGNEFRRFDTRSLRYITESVADIQSSSRHWDVFLLPDQLRTFRRYASDNDINGRFTIRTVDGRNDMRESDYAWVHFSLPVETPMANGSIYVMGELTNWVFHQDNVMNYNYRERKYELSLLLKQGYYNYKYAFVEDGKKVADMAIAEGNHSITENDYSIFVYHRQPGTLYDRLVGITYVNSAIR